MKWWILCASLLSAAPRFEVASVKPAQPMTMGRMHIGMRVDDGMLRYSSVSLKDCIRAAYRVKEFQVQGPEWLASTRFEIVAKLPEGASREEIPEMLQSLLAERFKLSLHRDTREHAIYALVPAKGGPKLKPAEVKTGAELPRGAMKMLIDPAGMHLRSPSATLANVAEAISRFCERPVVDMSGIQGEYDFDLVFAPETMRNLPGGGRMMPPGGPERPPSDIPAEPAVSIYEAVKRYGLKLEPRKAPMEMLVVDQIEKQPTEN